MTLSAIAATISIVVIFALVDSLVVLGSWRSWHGRRRREHLWQTVGFLPLPLDLADTLASLAFDILGDLNQLEHVLLESC